MAPPVLHLHRQEVRWFHSPRAVTQCPPDSGHLLCAVLLRLKKDLKGLLVVHPAWYIKALITVVKPFIRSAPHRTHTQTHTE